MPIREVTPRAILGALSALALLIASGCDAVTKDTAQAVTVPKVAQPVVVAAEVMPAAPDALVAATGTIVYSQETTLSFKTGGVLTELTVDEGDAVKAKQRLARLDLTELAASVAQAEAAVVNADLQYERTRDLVEKGHVAQARLDDAALARDQARAGLSAVSFNRNLGVMTSPSDGVVLRRLAEPGQTLAPGAPVLQIGDTTSGLLLRVPVSAEQAARLKVGDKAEISVAGLAGPPRTGAIVRIAAKSNDATGNFDVDISAGDPALLRSGLIGSAQITSSAATEGKSSTVRIPTLALIDARADRGYVYVIDDKNVAHRRAVSTSGIDRGDVLVLSGLEAGERVIAEGAAYVRDGEAVIIADRP
ncbi:efflux RND transporter periplasmic adaptor subunit [Hyphomonas sp.]|uniref:efflux RND transporter periplasmic adaptor subunit n=1 Tax=Hyphomonas sp. TaxID=87 RepID=UPI0025C302E5|nr:efflux RND transporter periplasmic adaptor subunit [Hyphomonas sp.]